ncbi:MAG: hypothetical protein Q9222_004797 [Ikaeria aurantiellina]
MFTSSIHSFTLCVLPFLLFQFTLGYLVRPKDHAIRPRGNSYVTSVVVPSSVPTTGTPLRHGTKCSKGKGQRTSASTTYDALVPSNVASDSTGNDTAAIATLGHSNSSAASLSSNRNSSNSSIGMWAGAGIDTMIPAMSIPGRIFYDFDGKTFKDPIQILADAGLNAFRVQTTRGQCLGPRPFEKPTDERNFKIDFGCIDTKVKTAKQAIGLGMKMQLTINQGFNIPNGTEKYSYQEMIAEVQKETRRQLQPFLDEGIVPDLILFENEGSDGILFHEEATGHNRGTNDGKVSTDVVNQERCGQIPTGKMDSYPQLAGYYKAEVIACNEAIKAAGFPIGTVRYGLHSHGQYVQWKESVVHGPKQASQTKLTKLDGSLCEGPSPIPADILAMNASEVLTIAGFSAYPDPMTPEDVTNPTSLNATLDRLLKTLTQLEGYSHAYGKYDSGPFAGQYKLQAFGVEYATSFKYPDEIAQQQTHTEMMWDAVRKFSETMIGILWWEPWYCNNNWEGGEATLCHMVPGGKGETGEAPTDTLISWGAAAGT